MALKDIVNVQIARETTAVTQAGFGVLNILGVHKKFPERLRYYTSIDGVLGDFDAEDPEYKAAVKAFGQQLVPQRIAISRRSVDTAIIAVTEVENSAIYTCTINDVVFSITSGTVATANDIAAALVSAINAGAEPVTATDNLDGSYSLEADVEDVAYTLKASSNQTIQPLVPSATVADDLTAINEEQNDWYGLMYTGRVQADVLAISEWIEAQRKIFGTASAESDIINKSASLDETSLAAKLKAKAYARTFLMYHPEAATEYPEAAWFGLQFPRDPGSSTWMFKRLAGIAVYKLNATQETNALAKNVNIYTNIGGVNMTQQGKVAEGEFIDIIRGVDWLQARMTEFIFSRLVNLPKIPYTDAGSAIIETEMRRALNLGIFRGFIAEDPAYTITIPKVADQPFNDRAMRYFGDIRFRANLSGAVHAVSIQGVVTV